MVTFQGQVLMFMQWRICLLLSLVLISIGVSADAVVCENDIKTGKVHAVNASNINIRQGPGREFDRVVDEKASGKKGSRQYAKVSKGHIVRVNCQKGQWSQINVLAPDWLRQSHRGWVMSRFLSK